jgi:pimeloyl-ACP methyl ester carboxylesterase/UDP:flavonoid glycosyltransferase YjiC (YdhE family)
VTTSGGITVEAPGARLEPPGASGGVHAEQTRARYADAEGFVERDGVRLHWERYGDGERAVLLMPTWSIVHSRFWKFQIPYLARHCRVVTFDGRGNGRSDRPSGAEANSVEAFAADALTVLDAAEAERVTLVGLSCGALWSTVLAAEHPERVEGIVYIGPAVSLAPGHPERLVYRFDDELGTEEGWAKYNSHYWRKDYRGFLEFFFGMCLPEPHSTKVHEDCVAWALDTDPETLADTTRGIDFPRAERFSDTCARVRCRTLVIHGDRDLVRPLAQGAALADATGGQLVTLEGTGHLPQGRDPVRVNLLLRDFISPPAPPARWSRARERTKRALYLSSPIGLGHARRDVAIADELRRQVPGLEIEWLAQSPVTEVLEARGERVHPASRELASESRHITREAAEHELRVFQSIRRMDEILCANFMVFTDLVREEHYDVWIGDEAWELDHFLHENPELKSVPYVWLSDFIGWLPADPGDEREAALTADYNAEMLEQIARYPRVRDRSIFIGDREDIVAGTFGPGLPGIREWAAEHFSFSGYIPGFAPSEVADRNALRTELGYRPDERVVIVTVGGSGVGRALIERVMADYDEARRRIPGLRLIVVTGPRIEPARLECPAGVEVRPYVHDLYRHLAAADLAIVQGGLATTMELTASGRPFIYVPLIGHFEQQIHVRHRLERHRAGRCMEYDACRPGAIAEAMEQELSRTPDYLPVPADGAARAAREIASLL